MQVVHSILERAPVCASCNGKLSPVDWSDLFGSDTCNQGSFGTEQFNATGFPSRIVIDPRECLRIVSNLIECVEPDISTVRLQSMLVIFAHEAL